MANYQPPRAVTNAARRGLELYEAGQGGDGLKPETIKRAKRLAAGESMTAAWVREAAAWFARHDATRPAGDPAGTPWQVAWLLWGGDPGRRWVNRLLEQMEKQMDEQTPAAEAMADDSTDTQVDRVRSAFNRAFNPGPEMEHWVADVYLDDMALVCTGEHGSYRVTYTVNAEGEYEFAPREQWTPVKLTYVPAAAPAPADMEDATQTVATPAAPVTAAAPGVSARRAGVLRERLALAEAAADDATRTVKGVTLIRAGWSANADKAGRQRYYPAETLRRDGPSVFEGAHLHVNHPSQSEGKDRPEGDAFGVMGWYENVHWDDATASLKGDQVLVDRRMVTDELWPLIKAAVERKPDLIELSINAVGTMSAGTVEGRAAQVVETIERGGRPARVDIVTRGAAGGSFQGALLAADASDLTDDLLRAMPFEAWRQARPEYVERLKTEWKTTRDTAALAEVRAELERKETEWATLSEQHRAEVAELAQLRRAATADRLLAASSLPHRLRPQVREQLLAVADEGAMQAVLASEHTKYQSAPKPPVTVAGGGQRPAAAAVTAAAPEAAQVRVVAGLMDVQEAVVVRPGEDIHAYTARRQRARS